MIIESIQIEGWRRYRERHKFTFKPGFNLLYGPNEAGKTTLFEALGRALFDKHSLKGEMQRVVPLGSSLAPQIELIFSDGGTRWRLTKKFLSSPSSKLWRWNKTSSQWQLDHEGDKADSSVRELFGGTASKQKATTAEHRGLAQALWYLQGDDPLPEKAWSDAIEHGVSGLMTVATRSPREDAIIARINTELGNYLTPGQMRPKKGGQLLRLMGEVEELEAQLAGLQGEALDVEKYREELTNKLSEQAVAETRRNQVIAEINAAEKAVQAANDYEAAFQLKREEAAEISRHLKELTRDDQQLDKRNGEIEELSKKLSEADSEQRQLQNLLSAESEAIAAARQRRLILEPELRVIELQLEESQHREQVEQWQAEQKRLTAHVREIETTQVQINDLKHSMGDMRAPDPSDWKEIEQLHRKIRDLMLEARASAITVELDPDPSAGSVKFSPDAEQNDQGLLLLTAPTEIYIEGYGRIRVRAGGSAAEIQKQLESEQAALYGQLEAYGAASVEALAETFQRRNECGEHLARLTDRLVELNRREPDAPTKLRSLNEKCAAAPAANPSVQMPELFTTAGLKQKRDELQQEIESIRKREESSQAKLESYRKSTEVANRERATIEGRIASLREENVNLLSNYATAENLRTQHAKAKEVHATATRELEMLKAQWREKVEAPLEKYNQVKAESDRIAQLLIDLNERVVVLQDRIEQKAASGFNSRLGDVEGRLSDRRRQLKREQSAADGVRLLYESVTYYRERQSASMGAPVARRLAEWLPRLSEGQYRRADLGGGLKPDSIQPAGFDVPLPISSLSYGMHEQVIVLLRLAIGDLLSEDEPKLIVLDDRLVNADPTRTGRMCEIISEVAKRCQVLVATCHPMAYEKIEGHRIKIPQDGAIEN